MAAAHRESVKSLEVGNALVARRSRFANSNRGTMREFRGTPRGPTSRLVPLRTFERIRLVAPSRAPRFCDAVQSRRCSCARARIAGVEISKLSLRNYGPDIAAPVLRMWHARGSKVPCRSREDCATIEGSGARSRDMWATRSGKNRRHGRTVPKTIGPPKPPRQVFRRVMPRGRKI